MSVNGSKGSLAKRLEALEQLITYRPPQLIVVTATPGNEEAAIASIKPRPTDADLVVVVMRFGTDFERKHDEHENPQD